MTRAAPVIDYSSDARPEGGLGTQSWALLVDAYRDLHSKKLFWITLVLSVLVVAAFAFVGINERGITIFGKELQGVWNTTLIPRDTFYKFIFTTFAIPVWLAWCASILALISVGGMFPDMLGSGSIDLYLSKPISRLRLFLTKYVCGLLFVALQVLVFSIASFLVIGIRGGSWEPGIFLAVPLVTLFFSYLFCMCALFGLLTRSTLAAILLTLLVWFGLFLLNNADSALLMARKAAEARVRTIQSLVKFNEDVLARNAALPEERRGDLGQYEFQRDEQKKNLIEAEAAAQQWRFWHRLVYAVKAPLPKTNETVALMSRWLVDDDPILAAERISEEQERAQRAERMKRAGRQPTTRRVEKLDTYMNDPETAREIHEAITTRSLAWVLGTSIGFEAVMLALAGFIFSRRDF